MRTINTGRRARISRRLAPCVLAAAALAVPVSQAQATVPLPIVDAACVHDTTIAFTPPLTLTPRLTRVQPTATLAGCISSRVVGGRLQGDGTGELACASGNVTGTFQFDWITTAGIEAHSTVAISGSRIAGFLGLAISGKVTSGLFHGDNYNVTFAASPLDLLRCLSPQGLTTLRGIAVGTFTKPLL